MLRFAFAFAAVSLLLSGFAPAQAELVVNTSKSQQRLAVVVDGTETYRWPVSTGRRGYDTPAGKFRPVRLERHWYSRQYDMTPMPWSVFFHRGYAVHGTMEAYNLGHAASHGCVRLRPDNAAILFSLVRRQGIGNTKIVVLNGALPAAPGAVPMADAGAPAIEAVAKEHFAKAEGDGHKAEGDGHDEYAAKAHRPLETANDDRDDNANTRRAARFAKTVAYRESVGSNEAQILREREAWLRSLDRKYGIGR